MRSSGMLNPTKTLSEYSARTPKSQCHLTPVRQRERNCYLSQPWTSLPGCRIWQARQSTFAISSPTRPNEKMIRRGYAFYPECDHHTGQKGIRLRVGGCPQNNRIASKCQGHSTLGPANPCKGHSATDTGRPELDVSTAGCFAPIRQRDYAKQCP